jgi:molecular chaperone DnaK
MASLVGFAPDGQVLVGEAAASLARSHPENVVSAAARLVARRFDSAEIQQARRFLPYQLVEGANGDVHVQVGPKTHSPTEILSSVPHRLKRAAEAHLSETVVEAVVTVPASSFTRQRQAIKEAFFIAGLRVTRVMSGSTAAALEYGRQEEGGASRFVAVYDLGGGTFDFTILELTGAWSRCTPLPATPPSAERSSTGRSSGG